MDIIKEETIREETVFNIAKKMALAARTAPKAKGKDNIEIVLLKKNEIKKVSDKLKKMVIKYNLPQFFIRDAVNILSAEVIFAIGTKISSTDLPRCGMCGFKNCDEKNKYPNHPCVFNTGDLGIAIGSAVSIAADNRIDNRIMYTVGQALIEMKTLGEDIKIVYAIPLSASRKNPFVDRNNKKLIELA